MAGFLKLLLIVLTFQYVVAFPQHELNFEHYTNPHFHNSLSAADNGGSAFQYDFQNGNNIYENLESSFNSPNSFQNIGYSNYGPNENTNGHHENIFATQNYVNADGNYYQNSQGFTNENQVADMNLLNQNELTTYGQEDKLGQNYQNDHSVFEGSNTQSEAFGQEHNIDLTNSKPNVSKKISKVLNKIIDRKADLMNNMLGLFNGALKNGIHAVKDGLIKSTDKIFGSFQDRIMTDIEIIKSDIIKVAISEFQKQLKQLQQLADNLLITVKEKTSKTKEVVDEAKQKSLNDVNNFATDLQNKVSKSSKRSKREAQGLIDNFVTKTNGKIENLGSDVIASVEELDKKAHQSFKKSVPLMNNVVQRIEDCTRRNPNDKETEIACASQIRQEARALKSLPHQYSDISSQLNNFNPYIVLDSINSNSFFDELSLEKDALSNQINQVIESENSAFYHF